MSSGERRFWQAVIILNGLCLGLFGLRILLTGTVRYWFVPENLLLANIALIFGWLLAKSLSRASKFSSRSIGLAVLWLAFLPNTWYVMTDFIHIDATGEISQLYDIALINSLVICGFLAGFTSLLVVHKQLLKRYGSALSAWLVGLIILLASFSIYLGRDLRWNSWDILANPGGLVLNVSDRLTDPFGHPRMLNVTGLFFITIATSYTALWQLAKPRN